MKTTELFNVIDCWTSVSIYLICNRQLGIRWPWTILFNVSLSASVHVRSNSKSLRRKMKRKKLKCASYEKQLYHWYRISTVTSTCHWIGNEFQMNSLELFTAHGKYEIVKTKKLRKKNISIVFFSNVYISAEEGTSKCFPKCIGFWRHFVFGWLEKRIIILLQTTHHARSFGTLIALLRPLLRCRTLHQFNENLIYAFQRNVKQNLVRLQPMPSVATQCDPLINSNHLALKTL